MVSGNIKVTFVLVLCLSLVFGPALLSAQETGTERVLAEKVNLNTATPEQLQSLPGIGPTSAKDIIEYRKKVGKFNRIEEIINVKGIGEKKFLKIKSRLMV